MFLKAALIVITITISKALPRSRSWADDTIVSQHQNIWNGNFYSYGFQTLLGISRREKGSMKEDANGNQFIDVIGEYSYPMSDGLIKKITYSANNLGYNQGFTMHMRPNIVNEDHRGDDYKTVNAAKFNEVNTNKLSNNNLIQNTAINANDNFEKIYIKPVLEQGSLNLENLQMNNTKEEDVATGAQFPAGSNAPIGVLTTESPLLVGNVDQTGSLVVPANQTSMDYYYDELGNRIGGVPPAVLGSLLG